MECPNTPLTVSNIVLTLVIAGVAGYIAWRQWITARNKLNFDMFEARLPVYDAAMTYLISVINNGDILAGKDIEFLQATRNARWLFDKKFADYLKEDIYRHTGALHAMVGMLPTLQGEQRKTASEAMIELKDLLGARIGDLESRGAEFLQLRSD